MPAGVERATYVEGRETDLKPWLLAAALILFIFDTALGLVLRGLMPMPRFGAAARAASVLVALLAFAGAAEAQTRPQSRNLGAGPDAFAMEASLETRLAYVITGNASLDETSRAGLSGLTRILNRRTAVEAAEPIGVNLEDDGAFLPVPDVLAHRHRPAPAIRQGRAQGQRVPAQWRHDPDRHARPVRRALLARRHDRQCPAPAPDRPRHRHPAPDAGAARRSC